MVGTGLEVRDGAVYVNLCIKDVDGAGACVTCLVEFIAAS